MGLGRRKWGLAGWVCLSAVEETLICLLQILSATDSEASARARERHDSWHDDDIDMRRCLCGGGGIDRQMAQRSRELRPFTSGMPS